MSTPSAKRRRLDEAQSVLRKPFRSPFKTPVRSSAKADADSADASVTARTPLMQSVTPSSPAVSEATPQSSSESTSLPASSLGSSTQAPQTPPVRQVPTSHTPSIVSASVHRKTALADLHSPALQEEQQRQRQLNREIGNLRTEIDTLNQALTIASSTKDAELEELIVKWREASKAAAEEVFSSVRDRVNRMGGVGAWREREQRQQEWRKGFGVEEDDDLNDDDDDADDDNDDDDEDEEGNPLTPERKEERKIMRERQKEAREEARRERAWRKEEWEREKQKLEEDQPKIVDEGRDDDTFTMDMMLQTLNIELEVIGWDKASQRWIG